jgi:hypothetical protein
MPGHKFVTDIFHCPRKDLQDMFHAYQIEAMFRNGGEPPAGSLSAANGVAILDLPPFSMPDVAERALLENTKPGGQAGAVQLAMPDPKTGSPLDPRTGERRMVWLVGARVPEAQGTPGWRR